ncbi:MAG: hypothetical protein ACYS6W_04555, partial [Planctomycetota bacterium]
DPCDFLLTAGRERFEQLADEAVDVFQFKWNRLMESFGVDDTLTGKKRAIEEFLQTIAASLWAGNLPAIDRGLIVNRLAKIIGAEPKEINAELSGRITRAAKAASYHDTTSAENQKVQSIDFGQGLLAVAQREVLEVLLNEPKLFETVKQRITAEDFDVPILRQIADILFQTLGNDINASLAEILTGAESVEAGSVIVQLAQGGEEKGNFESRLAGALNVMKRINGRRKKSEVKAIDDQTRFLRSFSENAAKENPHNVGMV